ncbi:MAG: glycosyltransferase family 4 protein [Gluconacetobacter diazotrophicus]|nr:glycosyltransferase family 4 protein [Gluconacetobacter diazotrophicus]
MGDTARNPARSGIQTVVRSLAGAFAGLRAPVRFVAWNNRRGLLRPLAPELSIGEAAEPLRDPNVRWPRELWSQPGAWPFWLLSGFRGKFIPLQRHPLFRLAPPGTWVLMPELMYKERAAQLVEYVRRRGWRLAVILYDTIPVEHPEYVPPALPAHHAGYLRAFAQADLILPISEASARGWRSFLAAEGLPGPPVQAVTLACDLVGIPRVTDPPAPAPSQGIRLLCVSTLEPRKNHAALLAAYERVVAARPDLQLSLDLVGAAYGGSEDIEKSVRAAAERLPGLRWHGQVEYDELRALYARCDFTVYPSLIEGFGLPVIESLWFGRPCLCANFGVMAENAAGGGCLTADVRDPQALADAILTLATDGDLRRRLTAEATARPLKTWAEYAREILACLAAH